MDTAQDQAGATRAAVLGTGIMGSAMARNLIAAGLPTTEFPLEWALKDVDLALAEAGARSVSHAGQAAFGVS